MLLSKSTCYAVRGLIAATTLFVMVGCSSTRVHPPVPKPQVNQVILEAMPNSAQPRIWGDASPTASRQWLVDAQVADQATYPSQGDAYLAISGGGADGAFGAGVLCGWTDAGTRPQFKLVTGISTGALAAPFALLGPQYDTTMREIYTKYQTDDLLSDLGLRALFVGDAAANSKPLRDKILLYITDQVIEDLAQAHRDGRTLLIGTTNLDAERPVIWNITYIAASDAPDKAQLIRNVLLASASIPGAFPPVFFDVKTEPGGPTYSEMHVDGGAIAQVFLGPAWSDWKPTPESPNPPNIYIIRNGKLGPEYQAVNVSLLSIASRAMSSLIKSSGIADVFRMYIRARDNGIGYHLAYIPGDFDATWDQMFDPVYMKKLFDVGYELGKSGQAWVSEPPSESEGYSQ